MEASISSLAFFLCFFFFFPSFCCFSQVRSWRQGGALPGKGEAVAPGLQRPEGRSERSRRVFRRVPAAPGLPAHVVAALLQRGAAVAAEGLRGHAFQQRLRWRERGSKSWSRPPCVLKGAHSVVPTRGFCPVFLQLWRENAVCFGFDNNRKTVDLFHVLQDQSCSQKCQLLLAFPGGSLVPWLRKSLLRAHLHQTAEVLAGREEVANRCVATVRQCFCC